MGSSASSNVPDYSSAESWPVRDDKGYVQSYKEDSLWVNWWNRHKPCLVRFIARFLTAKDHSSIPHDESELDSTLPVITPYWLASSAAGKARAAGAPGCRATWLGHATVLAEVDTRARARRPHLQPPRQRRAVVRPAALPPARLQRGAAARRPQRRDNFDIADDNLHELVWWEEARIPGKNASVMLTPSNHWGAAPPSTSTRRSGAAGWSPGPHSRFFFGGDTAYADAFEQIGRRLGPFNLAAIPIGAYEPRALMRNHHVNPEEAVRIHEDIGSKQSFGIHWGTFKLTYEHYLEPREKTIKAAEKRGLAKGEFVAVNIGVTVEGRQ
ncbi:unnamed protein product [Sphagnum tenellum]